LLPGYGDDHSTLEIFSYDEFRSPIPAEIIKNGGTSELEKQEAELIMKLRIKNCSKKCPDL